MLSEREKQGLTDLLMQLDLKDLLNLTDTVTNRAVSAENRQEAVHAILLYTVNAAQLLKRKKVKREHLYKYLAQQGYIESTNSDKPSLCEKILQLWGSSEEDEAISQTRLCTVVTDCKMNEIRSPCLYPDSTHYTEHKPESSYNNTLVLKCTSMHHEGLGFWLPVSRVSKAYNSVNEQGDKVNDATDNYDSSETTGSEQNALSSGVQTAHEEIVETEGQKLAEQFIPWFYGLLNSVANNVVSDGQDCWGPHHFWDDAKCSITMISCNNTENECQGAVASSHVLTEVVSGEKLFLNVNHSSIKGHMDTYGLGRINTGGTVHRFQQCIGIFEQSFGLIRDPLTENNWKIKFTHLKLKAQGQSQGRKVEAAGSMMALTQ